MIPPEILDFYRLGLEEHRLDASLGRLERIRTWDILDRYLPPPPARVLDVGGGTGVYALPLAARGYNVHLVDIVSIHVERAHQLSSTSDAPLVKVEVGDARNLSMGDATVDVVLLFGPLYHLTERNDRIAALREARRVLKRGGLLLSAYISRFASACDGIQEGALRDPAFADIVNRDLTDGVHQNPTGRPEWFTTAYLHRPEEIAPEIEHAGLTFDALLAVEGPGWFNQQLDSWLEDAPARDRLLDVLRRVEREPTLLGASAHLMAVSRRQPATRLSGRGLRK